MVKIINPEIPFIGWKIYGPYKNQDTRFIVQMVRPNGSRTGMDYGRYLMCVKEGRILDKSEVVDHIDNNPSNNDLSNLQILTQAENVSKNHKKPTYVKLVCSYCGKEFTRLRRQSSVVKGYNNDYCNRECNNLRKRR